LDAALADHSTGVLETYAGVFKLRFPRHGQYKLFIIHSVTKEILSSVHKIHVQLCGDNVIPSDLPLQSRFSDEEEEKQPPRPLVRHPGVLAISGHHPVLVPQSVLPPLHSNGGSFSVSFWFRLLDSAAGNFRAFFYKGTSRSLCDESLLANQLTKFLYLYAYHQQQLYRILFSDLI